MNAELCEKGYVSCMENPQPTREQARAVAIYLRGADDFAHEPVDWLAVGRLGSNLSRSPAPAFLYPWSSEPPPRARAALEMRRAIVSGERPTVRDAPVSFETLGAVYFILTAGQYTQECPNHVSPRGKHRWRFETADCGAARKVCDYCGDERLLKRAP